MRYALLICLFAGCSHSMPLTETVVPPACVACDPYRDGTDYVSSADCAFDPATPVCDALSRRCVPPPAFPCGACTTDAQCDDLVAGSTCATLPGVGSLLSSGLRGPDRACIAPCDLETLCRAYGLGCFSDGSTEGCATGSGGDEFSCWMRTADGTEVRVQP